MIRTISSLLIIAGLAGVNAAMAAPNTRGAASVAAPNTRGAAAAAPNTQGAASAGVGHMAMHAHLTRAEPAPDDTVRTAPTAIRLWFSEAIEVALTSVIVTGPSGVLPIGQPSQASGSTAPVVFDAGHAISSGGYTVSWRTVGRDGHPTHGSYRFIVAPTRQPAASTHQ